MEAPPGSSYSVDPDGLWAIFSVLEEQDLARRWEREIRRLPADVDRLVIWSPPALESDEWKQVEDWVDKGGTAIIAIDSGSRLKGSVKLTDIRSAGSAAAHPVSAGVNEVAIGGGAFSMLREGALTHLTLPDGTPVMISWAHGRGRFYWSADQAWLTNAMVGKGDNLTLALGLLAPGKGKQVAFDEYHHGYQAADRWWQLLRGNLQWFVAILTLGAAVMFWAYGARFGAPVPTPAGPSRASVEYVLSMSQLYRRARADKVVRQNLYRSLMRDLSRLLGGIQGLSHTEIAHRASGRTGMPAQRISEALERTGPDSRSSLSDKDLIVLAREVETIQRSVTNAGYRDQQRPGTGTR